MSVLVPWALASLLVFAACGGGGGGTPVDAGPPLDAAPDFGSTPAQIRVTAASDNEGGAYATSISGALREQALPTLYAVDPPVGSCRTLHAVAVPLCDPACPDDALCTDEDVCTPYPPHHPAGTLHVAAGAVSRDVAYDAFAGYGLYDADLRFPVGATITASAPGDAFPGFELSTSVPPALVVENPDELRLEAGQPLTIRWTPGDPLARVRVTLLSDTASHGLFKPSVIECDLPDTGELTIPATLIDAHLDPANWGCGDCASSSIARYRRVVTTVDGKPVELIVESALSLYLVDYL
jgi:hypothetical protein